MTNKGPFSLPTVASTSVILSLCLLLMPPLLAASQARVALVVGNSDYHSLGDLDNPANDAAAVVAKLKQLGFSLIGKDGKVTGKPQLNLSKNQFILSLRQLERCYSLCGMVE